MIYKVNVTIDCDKVIYIVRYWVDDSDDSDDMEAFENDCKMWNEENIKYNRGIEI